MQRVVAALEVREVEGIGAQSVVEVAPPVDMLLEAEGRRDNAWVHLP